VLEETQSQMDLGLERERMLGEQIVALGAGRLFGVEAAASEVNLRF